LSPLPPDRLSEFLAWFLCHGLAAARPAGIYDYGPVRSLVLFRGGEFQVELFTVAPGYGFGAEHRHPDVDSYEVHVWGEIVLTINGQDSAPVQLDIGGRPFLITRVTPDDWHGAHPMSAGGAFFSVQHWLNGVPPTSVGLNWVGAPPSAEHALRLQEIAK
jgi:hypothetical protein